MDMNLNEFINFRAYRTELTFTTLCLPQTHTEQKTIKCWSWVFDQRSIQLVLLYHLKMSHTHYLNSHVVLVAIQLNKHSASYTLKQSYVPTRGLEGSFPSCAKPKEYKIDTVCRAKGIYVFSVRPGRNWFVNGPTGAPCIML